MDLKRNGLSDSHLFLVGAFVLLATAIGMTWSYFHWPPELALSLGGAAVVLLAAFRPELGSGGALFLTAVSGAGYLILRSPLFLPPIGLGLLATLVPFVLQTKKTSTIWYALTGCAFIASWAFYFHFVTLGVGADTIARRMVLSLGWLGGAVAFVLVGNWRRILELRQSGHLLFAIAMAKILFYDMGHLDAPLRIATLVLGGGVTLVGALVSRGKEHA